LLHTQGMDRFLGLIPPWLVSLIGRFQFRVPAVRRVVSGLAPRLTERTGTIAHGVGQALRFTAAGGYPGYLLGTSEPDEQRFLQRHLHPGAVFYDIGANIGFFSTIAGRLVGPAGSVWAFEPLPESADAARRNAELNHFRHVHVIEAAVSSGDGLQTLRVTKSSATHKLATTASGAGPTVEVLAIDSWRSRTGAPLPSLVQIDVEGAVLNVLRGMVETLKLSRAIVLCEVHWIGGELTEFVETQLTPFGYALSALDGQPSSSLSRWHAVLSVSPIGQAPRSPPSVAPPRRPSVTSRSERTATSRPEHTTQGMTAPPTRSTDQAECRQVG
jgi:FkbM family methyltransferase